MQAAEVKELLHIGDDKSKLITLKWVVQAIDELLQTNQELLEANTTLIEENEQLKARLERLA
jgi:hypothetical protein